MEHLTERWCAGGIRIRGGNIMKPGDKVVMNDNYYVWVISFERISKDEVLRCV